MTAFTVYLRGDRSEGGRREAHGSGASRSASGGGRGSRETLRVWAGAWLSPGRLQGLRGQISPLGILMHDMGLHVRLGHHNSERHLEQGLAQNKPILSE